MELPLEYGPSLHTDRTGFMGEIRTAVRDFMREPDVHNVVLICLNHGEKESAGLGRPLQKFDYAAFWALVTLALDYGKRILFVLGACRSQPFAESVWAQLHTNLSPTVHADLASSVGFLTSTSEYGLTSAVVLSKDPDLVYLIKEDRPAPPQMPQAYEASKPPQSSKPPRRGKPDEASETAPAFEVSERNFEDLINRVCATEVPLAETDDFALGYRIHSSMFGRQLLHLWTYVLKRADRIKLKDLPALLNSEAALYDSDGNLKDPADNGWFCNGFDAAFVGATAADSFTDLMRDRLVDEFLPLGPVDPEAELPGFPGVKFREFIPAEQMGDLYDDMCHFRRPGSTFRDFKGLFVEITKGDNGVEVVGSAPCCFEQKLRAGHPIAESVYVAWATASPGPSPEVAPRVPWLEFSRAIIDVARAKGWYDPPGMGRIAETWFDFAEGVLARVNGERPSPWPFMGLFTDFARRNEGKEVEFERTIRVIRDQLVDQLGLRDGPARPRHE
jgi:hypothetical protein